MNGVYYQTQIFFGRSLYILSLENVFIILQVIDIAMFFVLPPLRLLRVNCIHGYIWSNTLEARQGKTRQDTVAGTSRCKSSPCQGKNLYNSQKGNLKEPLGLCLYEVFSKGWCVYLHTSTLCHIKWARWKPSITQNLQEGSRMKLL